MSLFLEYLRLAFPVTNDWRTSLMLDRMTRIATVGIDDRIRWGGETYTAR